MLIFVDVCVDGRNGRALVDTGCQQSMVSEEFCAKLQRVPCGSRRKVRMLNGEITYCAGNAHLNIQLEEQMVGVWCLVASNLVCNVDVILGLDAIIHLGGMCVDKNKNVVFNVDSSIVAGAGATSKKQMIVEDTDFRAEFDGERWVVAWKWREGEPTLTNKCGEYAMDENTRQLFEDEVDQWIENGWLEPYQKSKHGEVNGVIPLMAAKQPNKQKKVRPVLDYRELNGYVESRPGHDTAVCQEKLRRWRCSDNASLLDLKKAYLQVHIVDELQRFQTVKYKGQMYVMTRMGFGLSVAPKVMSRIISNVLALQPELDQATDHYIDDIWVDGNKVHVADVKTHLEEYGLITKDPVSLNDARVLGLRVSRNAQGVKVWKRDSELPVIRDHLTKRELFSVFGKLVGHYPVAGWLRVACSYVKRLANETNWDERVSQNVEQRAREIVQKVMDNDPVCGGWLVVGEAKEDCVVWCDASNLAMGVCVEIDGNVVEDASWLRKEDDGSHINVAELEAVLKGLTLALKWGRTEVKVMTDSACVHGWIRTMLEGFGRPRVSGLSEMIIRRRLMTMIQLVEEYGAKLSIELVPSNRNIADELTRVPKKWLQCETVVGMGLVDNVVQQVEKIHNDHHLGVERTVYLAEKQLGVPVSKNVVGKVVKNCQRCRSIDPHPVKWEHGTLDVTKVWGRLAIDITHVSGSPYLSVIDCGPSRFAVWRKLRNETTDAVVDELNNIFRERGAPSELLSDNGPCFKSRRMLAFVKGWGIAHKFSCAYRPTGNGIVERNHRTIKTMVARSGRSVEDMLFWYNQSPNVHGVVPADAVYSYTTALPHIGSVALLERDTINTEYKVGDVVYLKPKNARCNDEWEKAEVTGIVSEVVIEVNGTNRHISDIRFCESGKRQDEMLDAECREVEIERCCCDRDQDDDVRSDAGGNVDDDGLDGELEVEAKELRERRPPKWLADFYVG